MISEAESMIESAGELVSQTTGAQRRMAYEIDHRPEAEYRLYQFEGENALLERLNQRLRIMDGVLRFRIIRVKPGKPTPPPPDQQAPRRRDDREPQEPRWPPARPPTRPRRTRPWRTLPRPTRVPWPWPKRRLSKHHRPRRRPPRRRPEAPPSEPPVEEPPPADAPPADAPPAEDAE